MRINVDLSINDYDRRLFTEHRTVMETRAGESMIHIALKIIGIAMFYDDDILIEPSMHDDERFKPNLLIRHDDHRPKLWVECGQCRVSKLDKVSFKHYEAEIKMLKRTSRKAREIMQRCEGVVRRIENLECIGFDNNFIEAVASVMTGKNDIVAILSGASLQLVVGGETFNSTIHRFKA